jgi:hypothetical protein
LLHSAFYFSDVSRLFQLEALDSRRSSGGMKKMMLVLGALSLVGCGGSGDPHAGGYYPPDGGWAASGPVELPGTGTGGASETAGTSSGGYEAGGAPSATGGSGSATAGTAAGGATTGGTSHAGGGAESGGEETGGTESGGGSETGGTGSGAAGSGGYEAGGSSDACALDVVHCFDAAANCYEYSPWSDCDQIVDVCAAMQAACTD